MRSVSYASQFFKDLKREGKSPRNRNYLSELQLIIELLCVDAELPKSLRDHELVGMYNDMRELHVRPDLLLIYRKFGDHSLHLARLGSHSELF